MNSDSDILGSILETQFTSPRGFFASLTVVEAAIKQAQTLVEREDELNRAPSALHMGTPTADSEEECRNLLEANADYAAAVAAIAPACDDVRDKIAFLQKEVEHFKGEKATYETVDELNHARETLAALAAKPVAFVHPIVNSVALSLYESTKDEVGAWVVAQEDQLSAEAFDQLKTKYYRHSSDRFNEQTSGIEIGRAIAALRKLEENPDES